MLTIQAELVADRCEAELRKLNRENQLAVLQRLRSFVQRQKIGQTVDPRQLAIAVEEET